MYFIHVYVFLENITTIYRYRLDILDVSILVIPIIKPSHNEVIHPRMSYAIFIILILFHSFKLHHGKQ